MARHRPCCGCGRPGRARDGANRVPHGLWCGPAEQSAFHHCGCQAAEAKTFSPLTTLLTEHTAPELLYLESRWASLVSFGLTAALLKEVLPVGSTANAATVRCHLHKVADRHDADLGAEQPGPGGGPAAGQAMPIPQGAIIVGIDGGYVRNWHDKKKKFEVIVGKSMAEDCDDRYFGLVRSRMSGPSAGSARCCGGRGCRDQPSRC